MKSAEDHNGIFAVNNALLKFLFNNYSGKIDINHEKLSVNDEWIYYAEFCIHFACQIGTFIYHSLTSIPFDVTYV